jgi:NADH-quinone oxidoreductase subunit L
MWCLAIVGSALTSFYMFRVFILTFFGDFRGTEAQAHHLHESPISMTLPLMVLAVLSVIGGLINLPHFAGGNEFLAHWLAPILPEAGKASEVSFLSLEMGAPLLAAFLPAFFAIYLFGVQKSVPAEDESISGIQKVIYNKFYIDELYDVVIVKPITVIGNFCFQVVEFLVIDLIVEGVGRIVAYASTEFRRIQTGNVGYYIFIMVISIAVILAVSLRTWIL